MSIVVRRATSVATSIATILAMLAASVAAADPKPAIKDEDPEPKLSLPTESDRVAWTTGGFRLGLGLAYGDFAGLRGAPSGRLLGARMHAGLRLDRDWSLMSTFEYASASKAGGLSGLRFMGTVDPTWHVTRALSIAVGFGFGGIVEGKGTGRPDVAPFPGSLDSSYTYPSSEHPLPSCSGVGEAVVGRVDYAWVIGPRASTHVSVDAIGQYTKCVDPTGRVEPDTAQPIVRVQYWSNAGVEVEWGFTWR